MPVPNERLCEIGDGGIDWHRAGNIIVCFCPNFIDALTCRKSAERWAQANRYDQNTTMVWTWYAE